MISPTSGVTPAPTDRQDSAPDTSHSAEELQTGYRRSDTGGMVEGEIAIALPGVVLSLYEFRMANDAF